MAPPEVEQGEGTAPEDIEVYRQRLRAVADPTRLTIVDALLAGGPATSNELGRLIPVARSSMAWHLETLRTAGLVEPVGGDGRGQKWMATRTPVLWHPEFENDESIRRSIQELERVVTNRRIGLLRAWADERYGAPWKDTAWASSAVSRDYMLPALEPAELEELERRVVEVVDAFREEMGERGRGERRETVFMSISAFPFRPRPRP